MTFVWPWFLAALARRPARAGARALARPAPLEVRGRVHESRRARLRRDVAPETVALGTARALPARAHVGVGRARTPEGEDLGAFRSRDDRAARRRLRLDARERRQADAPRCRAGGDGHLRRQGAEGRQGRPRLVQQLARPARDPDRPTARCCTKASTCSCRRPVPRSATASARRCRSRRTALVGRSQGQGRQAAGSDRAALGRSSDPRCADAAAGRGARPRGRDSRLHGRARHEERHARRSRRHVRRRPRRPSAARAVSRCVPTRSRSPRSLMQPTGRRTRRGRPSKVQNIYKQLGASIATRSTTREISSWFAGVAALLLFASLGAARITGERIP